MTNDDHNFEAIKNLSKRAYTLDGISALLGWDQETYMPKQAASLRASQREIMAELSHSIKTSPQFEKALSHCIDISSGEISAHVDERKKAALCAWRRDFLKLKKLPIAFVQHFTKLTSEAIHVWQQAKQNDDFLLFKPYLTKIVAELQKKADLLGYENHPYDALLDDYEPGCKTHTVDKLFQEIKTAITPLVKKCHTQHTTSLPTVHLSAEEQLFICNSVLDYIGYDKERGRIDLSEHPFCGAYHPTDCRITTRLETAGFHMPVLTTLHEAGHGFYEMGLPVEYYGTPLGEHVSLGIHESQSRFWETRIGRSLPFWEFLLPLLAKHFPGRFEVVRAHDLLSHINQVKPSFIRVDADEVTYPLHVILRFEIEKELIEGTLQVDELPERWNSAMQNILGITPRNNREGCLQDIHWSMGAFGYFPTYTLGNVFCAELFYAFEQTHPDWADRVRAGDFSFIREWNYTHIHQYGRQYTSTELVERTTSRSISSKHYLNYLAEKYLPR